MLGLVDDQLRWGHCSLHDSHPPTRCAGASRTSCRLTSLSELNPWVASRRILAKHSQEPNVFDEPRPAAPKDWIGRTPARYCGLLLTHAAVPSTTWPKAPRAAS